MARWTRRLTLALFGALCGCQRSLPAPTPAPAATTAPAPVAAPPRPLPSQGQTPTQKSLGAVYRRFEMAAWLDAYESNGPPDPRWDKPARRFLQQYVSWLTNTPQPVPLATVARSARELDNLDCDDPVALLAMAEVSRAARDRAAADLYEDLRPLFDKYPLHSAVAWLGPLGLARTKPAKEFRPGERIALVSKAAAAAARAASKAKFAPYEEDWLWWRLRPDHQGPPAAEFLAALRKQPHASPWILAMLRGEKALHVLRRAKAGRATADAQHLLAAAHDAFTKAYQWHPEYPAAAARLIALPGAGETARLWFDRAVAANFDTPDAYVAYRATLSAAERLTFGRQCLATGRFDTLVPWELGLAVSELVGAEATAALLADRALADELQRLATGYQTTRPALAARAQKLREQLPTELPAPAEPDAPEPESED